MEDFDRAQMHALDCALRIFPAKLFQSLIEMIPDPPFDFQDEHPIESLHDRVRICGSEEALKRFVDSDAVLWEQIIVAWAFHHVIQQVSIARLNNKESHFGRYKDLLKEPNAWQVCLFGFAYHKSVWRG